MGKPHPKELRERVVAHVIAGNTHHSAAARFDVSIKFVNDMVKLKRETGSLAPKRQGNPGIGKLTPHADWVRAQVETRGEITLDEMTARLLSERGISVAPSSVWRLFQRLGLTHKKRHSGA
jgi:transposase